MINFSIFQDKQMLDISELVSSVAWSGRKGAAGRSLNATILDSPKFDRCGIDVFKGCQCIVLYDGSEIFRGIVIEQSRGKGKLLNIIARDQLIYFANNDDTFNYHNKKASEIFLDICTRFQISYNQIVDTGYIIPIISLERGKLWDCILESLQATYKAIGERFYITDSKGMASLIKRKETVLQWVIEDGGNLIDYNYSKSIDGIVTRVVMTSAKGSTHSTAVNSELEKKIGIFQKVIIKDDDLNDAQLQGEVDNTLRLDGFGTDHLSITGIGIPSVISGVAVYIIIPELGIKQSYYVDEDSHHFQGRYHEMRLTLNKTNEF